MGRILYTRLLGKLGHGVGVGEALAVCTRGTVQLLYLGCYNISYTYNQLKRRRSRLPNNTQAPVHRSSLHQSINSTSCSTWTLLPIMRSMVRETLTPDSTSLTSAPTQTTKFNGASSSKLSPSYNWRFHPTPWVITELQVFAAISFLFLWRC